MSATFEEWMWNASVYLQSDRYGQYSSHGWVAVSNYDEDPVLEKAVEDLEGGDNEMFDARDVINKALENGAWMGTGALPSEALADLEAKMREYQERVLDPQMREIEDRVGRTLK